MTTDSISPRSTNFRNSLYASGGVACWPCRNMVASRMIITRMTTHSAMFRYWVFKPAPASARAKKPSFQRSLADDFAVAGRSRGERPEPETRALAEEFDTAGQLDAPARRGIAEEARDPLEVHPARVPRGSCTRQRLAREAPGQGLRQRAPVLRVDPQPWPLGGEARACLPLDLRADPLAVPSLCFGQIGDCPEELGVEIASECGQRGAQPVARIVGRRVGGVLAPGKRARGRVALEIGARDAQERPHDPPVRRALGNAAEPVRPGAAQEPQEHRLHLIVRV